MKHKLTLNALLELALFLTAAPTAIASTTWYVDGVHGNDANTCKLPDTAACKTIGHAIALAHSGDSIMVAAATATYTENLTIRISLNVLGAGAGTIIDGGGKGTVVTIPNTSTSVILSGMTIRNGLAQYGGGVYNSGTLTITNTTISGNAALGIPSSGRPEGGGIYNGGKLTIYKSTVSGNVARPCGSYYLMNSCHGSGSGGGIYNGGTLTINKSTVSGNGADRACWWSPVFGWHVVCNGGDGGGINSFGTLTVYNSTVSGNVAMPGTGCGFFCFTTGSGGGISSGGGTLTISNSTISGNGAYQGGGIDGSATLQNSIVANNTGGDCSGSITSHGYNLSRDDTCNFTHVNHDLPNTDPLLGPLLYNVGPNHTQTMALLPGSPAIDAGNPKGCTDGAGHLLKTDQRGMPRPNTEDIEDKKGCDMGAYERQSD